MCDDYLHCDLLGVVSGVFSTSLPHILLTIPLNIALDSLLHNLLNLLLALNVLSRVKVPGNNVSSAGMTSHQKNVSSLFKGPTQVSNIQATTII
jgi:hypothetical protein